MKKYLLTIALLFFVVANSANAGLVINFTGSTGNAQADAGFQLAADYLSSQFNDNVIVTINRGFANLGAGVLGQASSRSVSVSYANWRGAVSADSLSGNDATFVANLPSGNSFSIFTNRTSNNGNSADGYIDSTGANTENVALTTANARALGFAVGPLVDAAITFSNLFNWDFDNTNGIDAGRQDFVGVAVHELMHAMGFISGVDSLDQNPNNLDDSFRVTGLDFTRHSVGSIALAADLDFTADDRAKYFSIDGGTTNLTPGLAGGWSRGVSFGDGNQASHWRDNLGLGIMDPTARPAGNLNIVTNLDLMALDVIGWNRVSAVPEPSSMVLVAISVFATLTYRRLKLARSNP